MAQKDRFYSPASIPRPYVDCLLPERSANRKRAQQKHIQDPELLKSE